MPSGGSRTNKWFEPTNIVGVIGVLSLGYTGYQDFQKDTGKEVSDLKVRVAVLEAGAAQRERRLDMIERGR